MSPSRSPEPPVDAARVRVVVAQLGYPLLGDERPAVRVVADPRRPRWRLFTRGHRPAVLVVEVDGGQLTLTLPRSDRFQLRAADVEILLRVLADAQTALQPE